MTDGPGIHRADRLSSHRWTVRTVAETGSTNADLLAAIERGDVVDHVALRAEHQTAGRGRLDRRWSAPTGANLLVSLCFVGVPEVPGALTQAVGVAAIDAIDALADVSGRVTLKWPNDVLIDDRKLAGVLAQRAPTGPVVVGIGLNVEWAPDGAASLQGDLALDVTPSEFLQHFLVSLDAHLRLDANDQQDRYAARLATLGRTVRIELPAGDALVGVAQRLDHLGRLIVAVGGGSERTVDVGDIVHLRTPPIDPF